MPMIKTPDALRSLPSEPSKSNRTVLPFPVSTVSLFTRKSATLLFATPALVPPLWFMPTESV